MPRRKVGDMSFPHLSRPENPEEVESPGLNSGGDLGDAFELKFQLSEEEGQGMEAWARQHLCPDRHGDGGTYRVTSVYCDTPHLDVFHRSPGYRRSKYRVRRYDHAGPLFLERKRKRGDQVRKKRVEIPEGELSFLKDGGHGADWVGGWFLERVRQKKLQPTCGLSYVRTAFFGRSENGPVRMTFDRQLTGARVMDWVVPAVHDGEFLLPGGVLLEMKYYVHLPMLFRELLSLLPAGKGRVSKYRLGAQRCGAPEALSRPNLADQACRNGEAHRDAV